MKVSKLPQLFTVRDLIKLYGLSAKQELSQNFILDKNITGFSFFFNYYYYHTRQTLKISLTYGHLCFLKNLDKLVSQCGSFKNSVALEVGPGFLFSSELEKIYNVDGSICMIGPGLLTRSIIDANPLGVIVVEKDRRFLPLLEVFFPFFFSFFLSFFLSFFQVSDMAGAPCLL
jgi:dimethyladenosine transferase 1